MRTQEIMLNFRSGRYLQCRRENVLRTHIIVGCANRSWLKVPRSARAEKAFEALRLDAALTMMGKRCRATALRRTQVSDRSRFDSHTPHI